METRTRIGVFALVIAWIGVASCTDTPSAPINTDAAPNPTLEVTSVPIRTVTFAARGELTSDWSGSFRGGDGGGEVAIIIVNGHLNGQTLHLRQRWEFRYLPPDPIITAELSGIVNTETGLVELNGPTSESGWAVVRGEASPLGGGIFNIGGSVMFNPQPEPPGSF